MANILNVPHRQQESDGLCLPACVQMVLAYLGETHSQSALARKMGTRTNIGTPHRYITRLRSDEIDVRYAAEGTKEVLQENVTRNLPVIVFVQTSEFPHWHGHFSRHAVVVVGITEADVWVLDPAAAPNPIRVPVGDFLLAWDEMDATYAIFQKASRDE